MTTNDTPNYQAAAARYMCMRASGELDHLTEREYLTNLEMIGITWNGPTDPPDAQPIDDDDVDEVDEADDRPSYGPFEVEIDGLGAVLVTVGSGDDDFDEPDCVCYEAEFGHAPGCYFHRPTR
jgi:hypothetical protein